MLDYDDLLLYWAHMADEPCWAGRSAGASTTSWSTSIRTPTGCKPRSSSAAPDGRGLTVVGDDAQSIYSFRAATVRNILDFPQHFIRRPTVITLEQNYRSTQPILDAANAVIALARERYQQEPLDRAAGVAEAALVTVARRRTQAVYVAPPDSGASRDGRGPASQAVLFRTSHHSMVLEAELVRRKIPFASIGGLKFLETAHVKDVLCVLALGGPPPRRRMSGFRIARLLPGVGAGKLPRAAASMRSRGCA